MEAFITMPKGYKATGISAGLKADGSLDMALITSDVPATIAGVYTSNLVKGHSLVRSINLISNNPKFRGIVINSKNANACVGNIGVEDAERVAKAVALNLSQAEGQEVSSSEILTASTGVIGTRLPIDLMVAGASKLVETLSSDETSAHNAERAIMTTDTVPKEVAAVVTMADGREVSLSGIAKGSGMIHPNLATMIGVFTTDAAIEQELLHKMLKRAVAHTFNRVSVDGDTSVCDMVITMANGCSGVEITEDSEDAVIFEDALTKLSEDIARMIASDGEGATKFIEIEVYGAKTEYDAKLMVTSVARSPLVKTAMFGMDANCGRIITALGYSGADFNPDNVDIKLSGLLVYQAGCAVNFDEEEADRLLHEHDIKIEIFVNEGDVYDRMFTCDFSYDYVKINGSYRT